MSDLSAGKADALALKLGEHLLHLEEGKPYVIGSSASSDLCINHGSVADRHIELTVHDGKTSVRQLSADHQTMLGEWRIDSGILDPGQTLKLGDIPVQLVRIAAKKDLTQLSISKGTRLTARRSYNQPFAEQMAEELRRAPWFFISAIVHAVLLLLLYQILEINKGDGSERTAVVIGQESEAELLEDFEVMEDLVEIEEEKIEDEEVLLDDITLDDFNEPDHTEEAMADFEFDHPGFTGNQTGLLDKIGSLNSGDILKSSNKALAAGGFKKTVSGIRRTGLEIIFVFDSTGSMGSILRVTKEKISSLVDALHALVPDARMGIVTYRDTGPGEDYTTRAVPLSHDVYRAINFIEVVRAGGGGDRPEAVSEGLGVAFQQKWESKARRVIILVGDAPPHPRSESKIQSKVKLFARKSNSYVHTIVTLPYGEGKVPEDTQTSFKKISRAGRGETITFDKSDTLLRQMMSLAFGKQYKRNIDEVYRIIADRKGTIKPMFRDLVRRKDLERIGREFKRFPVRDDLVRALLEKPSVEIGEHLIDLLQQPNFPTTGRHAIAHIIQQWLNLSEPPINAETERSLQRRKAVELRRTLSRRLR